MMSTGERSRVIVWALPKSRSTALAKSISARQDIKCYFEPYAAANHFGPGGRFRKIGLEESDYTFDNVKKWLEAERENVFVKDVAFLMQGRLNNIPDGYKHTFLIRKPEKVFASFYKMFASNRHLGGDTLQDWLPTLAILYKSSTDLLDHIENKLKGDVSIIDSDDIVKNPPLMIEKFCNSVGFKYTKELLHWNRGLPEQWCIAPSFLSPQIKGWFEAAITSTGWRTDGSESGTTNEALPEDMLRLIEDAIPFYEKLRSHPKFISTNS